MQTLQPCVWRRAVQALGVQLTAEADKQAAADEGRRDDEEDDELYEPYGDYEFFL